MSKKKCKVIECIEYLSVDAPLDKVNRLEDKQSRYIREYAKANYVRIVGTIRRNGFSMNDVDRQWERITQTIRKKQVDGIIVANMAAVSRDLPEAYWKVGKIKEAGGFVVTVDEGRLEMDIKGL